MADTEVLLRCPFCGAIDIIEQKAMYASVMKVVDPGKPAEDVELKLYVCS